MPLLMSKYQRGKSYQPMRGRLLKGAGVAATNISPARLERQQLKKDDESVKSERKKLFQAWTRF